ncbi:MAG: C1 family peptidase [Lentisphaeria bacterium]|nr:C1 family peptidase [Lentisphaeria bacterium]
MSSSGGYPESFSLPGFQLSGDQGRRGTCAAFSAVAMLEYLRGNKKRFSPQYIYASTHLSEEMRHQEGTEFKEIFRSVKEHGVCLYDQWPYNKIPAGEEAQISEELWAKIPVETFDDIEFEPLKTDPPRGIDEYKSVLCGAGGNRPSPISVGCLLFEDSLDDGQWLRLPGNALVPPEGLHAMTIYGWCDTPGMESRGFFRAANSWKGRHDIRIPYEYIEAHAYCAFCAVAPPEEKKESSAAQEKPEEKELPAEKQLSVSGSAAAENVMEKFFNDQQNNFYGDYPFPGIKLPALQSWGINARVKSAASFNAPQNRKGDFEAFLEKNGIGNVKGEIRIYRVVLSCRRHYRLVSAFLYRRDGKKLTREDLKTVYDYVEHFKQGDSPQVTYTHLFYTVGSAAGFDESCQVSKDPTVFLCTLNAKGLWTFKLPAAENECGWGTKEFFRHILPVNYIPAIEQEAANAVWGLSGAVSVATLKRELELYDENCYDFFVARSLDELFRSGRYAKDKKGHLLRIREGEAPPPGYKRAARFTRRSANLACGLVALSLLLLMICLIATGFKKSLSPNAVVQCSITAVAWILSTIVCGIRARKFIQFNR